MSHPSRERLSSEFYFIIGVATETLRPPASASSNSSVRISNPTELVRPPRPSSIDEEGDNDVFIETAPLDEGARQGLWESVFYEKNMERNRDHIEFNFNPHIVASYQFKGTSYILFSDGGSSYDNLPSSGRVLSLDEIRQLRMTRNPAYNSSADESVGEEPSSAFKEPANPSSVDVCQSFSMVLGRALKRSQGKMRGAGNEERDPEAAEKDLISKIAQDAILEESRRDLNILLSSPLFYACIQGNVEGVKGEIEKNNIEDFDKRFSDGASILNLAVASGNREVVKIVIAAATKFGKISNLLQSSAAHESPLMTAINLGNPSIFEQIISAASQNHIFVVDRQVEELIKDNPHFQELAARYMPQQAVGIRGASPAQSRSSTPNLPDS